MAAIDYAELHCHSAFSFLDGASLPESLIVRARELGLYALALTDTLDLGGMPRFSQAGREYGVDAIVGAELVLEDDSRLVLLVCDLTGYNNLSALITRARSNCERGSPRVKYDDLFARSQGLLALSGDENGVISRALYGGNHGQALKSLKKFREVFAGRFYLEVSNHHLPQENLVARRLIEVSQSTGVPWVVTNAVRYGRASERIVYDVLTCLKHRVTLAQAGRRLKPNGSWYLKSADEMVRLFSENLTGVKNTVLVAEQCQFRLGWLDPPLPAFRLSREAYLALSLPPPSSSSSASSSSALSSASSSPLPTPLPSPLPSPLPPPPSSSSPASSPASAGQDMVLIEPVENWQERVQGQEKGHGHGHEQERDQDAGALESSGYSYSELLRFLVYRGALDRYGDLSEKPAYRKQLEHELSLINRLKLAPYFLIMWDIVRFAQSRGIAVQGRGSAANSAVCYCLKITAVDPISMDLLFERFLSEGRSEPPDIDLDIAHQEREHVLQYVYRKYGRLHAAMVCEVITYRGRSAVRDAAYVLGFSQEQADLLASLVGHCEAAQAAAKLGGFDKSGAESESGEGLLRPYGFDLADRRVQLLLRVVTGLHQLPRHRSIHVGGFVLSAAPIGELVPVEPASMAERTVIQWDKDDLDIVGLIKIDLLGLGMLTMIQEALKLLQGHRRISLDIGKLDMFDENIYRMLQAADTVGVFQVESRAQMNILPKLRPTCFYDIIVSIAIVRPGPIQGNIIHPYLRRRQGLEPVQYLHASLEPILKRTLGVPLFQEQGMKLAVTAAGFTASQADELRKVMSHKRSLEKMSKLCQALAVGMQKNGFGQEAIETITHQLRAFASYGFPESHAASFSLLVYASAYLKHYYPAEFYCAMLNAQPMGFYSPASLLRDAMRHGVTVRPVDMAFSAWNCTLELEEVGAKETYALRLGIRFVEGLGSHAGTLIGAALEQGSFRSLTDVVERSGLGASELKLLANAGAFESFVKGRRKALWQVLSLLKPRRPTPLLDYLVSEDNYLPCSSSGGSSGSSSDTISILGSSIGCDFDLDPDASGALPVMSEVEEVMADFATMQLSTGPHPMSFYRQWAAERQIYSCGGLRTGMDGDDVEVAGGVICRQRPETAKGFVFLTLEDETGMANVVVNPRVYEVYRAVILSTKYLRVFGRLQLEQGVVNVIARHFEYLPGIDNQGRIREAKKKGAHATRDENAQSALILPSRNFH